MTLETPYRIEPALLEGIPTHLADLVAETTKSASRLGSALHPKTAASVAQMVRIMNTYYSNLIEGNATRPRDIERALLDGTLGADRRDLVIEAVAHVRVQEKLDRDFAQSILPEPASQNFIKFLHQAFYEGATNAMLTIKANDRSITMVPG
jgi:Fic family protein